MSHCGICNGTVWKVAYSGEIRDGAVGRYTPAQVEECLHCGVQKLLEAFRKPPGFYEGSAYRKLLGEPTTTTGFHLLHDKEQAARLQILYDLDYSFRGKVVMDVGAGAGAFLDHIVGLAKTAVGVEPCEEYRLESWCKMWPSIGCALTTPGYRNGFDLVTCFVTIEHVENPLELVSQMKELLKPGGRILISTPDTQAMHESQIRNYYRTQHNWYFSGRSLTYCMTKAGFNQFNIQLIRPPTTGLLYATAFNQGYK